MRASSHSPLATALLLIPILSIPLLAIFGVPQLTPTVPSALDDRETDAPPARSEAPAFTPGPSQSWDDLRDVQTAGDRLAESPWNDVASDATAQALANRRAERRAAPSNSEPTTNRVVPAAFEEMPKAGIVPAKQLTPEDAAHLPSVTEQAPSAKNSAPSGSQPLPRAAAAQPVARNPSGGTRTATEPLTWQSAVRRLNDLEIRNFRLEPGQKPEQFVFICSYTPQDNPRVSYRFEAEADEPLRAVEKVLTQIDAWLAGR
jgi:hypothetical protein